jgi:hypothetical protein
MKSGPSKRARWVIASSWVLGLLMALLFVSALIGTAKALPTFLRSIDTQSRLIARGTAHCSATVVSDQALLVWTITGVDAAKSTLVSEVRLVVPVAVIKQLDGAATATLTPSFLGVFQVVPDIPVDPDPVSSPQVRAQDMFVDSHGNLVGPRLTLTSDANGDSSSYPIDVYSLDSEVRLVYRDTSGDHEVPVVVSFDCRRAQTSGFEMTATSQAWAADGVNTIGHVQVKILAARERGGRVALGCVVVVSLVVGLFAFRQAKTRPTSGQNALLAATTALALIQVRPVIVPSLAGVWTITDRVLFLVIVVSASVFVYPMNGSDDGALELTDGNAHDA